MRLVKKQIDTLSKSLNDNDIATIKSAILDDNARGWSVFDQDGVEVLNEGLSETVTAVCSNLLDLATAVGTEIDEGASPPAMVLSKGGVELRAEPLQAANVLVLTEKSSGFRKAV